MVLELINDITSVIILTQMVKLAGKKHNINPTWKVLMKDVDLGEPTSFLDHVYLGCTQRECQISKDIVNNMFNSRISAVVVEKLSETRVSGKPDANTISSSSYDVEGHAKKCVEILQLIQFLLLQIGGHQGMALRLYVIVALLHSPAHNSQQFAHKWF